MRFQQRNDEEEGWGRIAERGEDGEENGGGKGRRKRRMEGVMTEEGMLERTERGEGSGGEEEGESRAAGRFGSC